MSSNTDTVKIWGAKTARSLRPIWMAEELEIDYELLPIGPRTGETLSEEYTKLNPKQKIPFLEHGDFKLSESLAMCKYLQNTFPSKNLFIPQTRGYSITKIKSSQKIIRDSKNLKIGDVISSVVAKAEIESKITKID